MGAETEYKFFVVVTAILVMAFFLADTFVDISKTTNNEDTLTSNVAMELSNEKSFSTEECYNLGGHLVNTVAGQRCAGFEVLLGNVRGYVSPTICCKEKI